jgi:hypothetical protein
MAVLSGDVFVVKPRCNGDCCFVNIVLKLFLAICSSILHSIGRTTIPQTSETFSSHQGVKQGGLLSYELYKLYIEDLLKTYEDLLKTYENYVVLVDFYRWLSISVVSFCIIYFNNHTFLWLEFISMSIT